MMKRANKAAAAKKKAATTSKVAGSRDDKDFGGVKLLRKPTKQLEEVARQIKNDDEFVAHMANIAARYRREHALDQAGRSGDVRRALRNFEKHAAGLAEWLRKARQPGMANVEHEALAKLVTGMRGIASVIESESKTMNEWLDRALAAVEPTLQAVKPSRNEQSGAALIAAEALKATFEYHKLKWSTAVSKQAQSDAVRALLAVAKSAGHAELTALDARAALREAKGQLV